MIRVATPFADQRRTAHRRSDAAVLDEIPLGDHEDEVALADLDLAAGLVTLAQPALDLAERQATLSLVCQLRTALRSDP